MSFILPTILNLVFLKSTALKSVELFLFAKLCKLSGMKLQRFFVEEKLSVGKEIRISDEDFAHQLLRVFRMETGYEIILLDNTGSEFLSKITLLTKKELVVVVLDKKEVSNIPKKEITLFASIIKKDHFEWVLEKCTELGVSHFVPVISERSEKKDLNMERARKILKEASEQSERGFIPNISEPVSLSESFEGLDFPAIALHLCDEKFDIEKSTESTKLGLFVGPEGGWGERDLELFKNKNIPILSLGSQVLRAETASVAVSAKILL